MKDFKVRQSYTDREAINLYLKDVRKYPLLSFEEEQEIARKAKEGDKKAINQLCAANLRFVISVAKQYQGQGLELPDLISEGNYGLIKSISKFDPDKGFKFISYAVWWIRQAIISAIQNNARIIRLPTGQILNLTKINKVSKEFEIENGRPPTLEELSELTELSVERISQLLDYNNRTSSLDVTFGQEEDAGTLLDVIPNTNIERTDKELVEDNRKQLLNNVLSKLSDRDHDILVLSYGIGTLPLDNKHIGELFGITGERIRQIKDKILMRLRTSKGLKSLYYGF